MTNRTEFEHRFPAPVNVEWDGEEYTAAIEVYTDGHPHEQKMALRRAHDHNLRWEAWQAASAGGDGEPSIHVQKIMIGKRMFTIAHSFNDEEIEDGAEFYAQPPEPAAADGEADGYCVIDSSRQVKYEVTIDDSAPGESADWAKSLCHEHINDCAGVVEGAGQWVVRPFYIGNPPAPVPEELTDNGYVDEHRLGYTSGWNECREAMLTAAPQPSEKSAPTDTDRLVEFAAIQALEIRDGGDCTDRSDDAWRSLPDHLQKRLNAAEEALDAEGDNQ